MQPRLALALAVAFASLAVGVVALDLRYSLEARLDERESPTSWRTITGVDVGRYPVAPGFGCAENDLRLVVTNDRLFSARVEVLVVYHGGQSGTILEETWSLERGESRSYEFTLPEQAFEPPRGVEDAPETSSVEVQIRSLGERHGLWTCVRGDD